MKQGVIYFNQGSKCLLRLIVSIYSLREYYNGPITVISSGDDSHDHCDKIFKNTSINIVKATYDKSLDGPNDVYLKKASVNTWTPYEVSAFLDADTLVRGPIDELFELAEKHGFVVPQFTNWTTNTKSIIRRIKGWEISYPDLMKDALKPGPAVNCGVFSFVKNTPFAVDWCDKIKPGRINFIPDETGMQTILHLYPHFVCDQKYNVSCKYSNPHHEDTRIIHYHGRKHCRLNDEGTVLYGGDLWLEKYEKAVEENFLNINSVPKDRMYKKFKNYKPDQKVTDKRITIVTAINPPYVEKLKTTLPTWQMKKQLKNCPLLVFHNGFKDPEKELAFIKKVSGREVTLVAWEMPEAESTRELMLSAFVLGAPNEVKTPYWLKIDADAYFYNDDDIILDHFYDYDLAGHKWKYTKPGKWICELDDWAFNSDVDGDAYLTEDQRLDAEKGRTYSHRRIASFVCMHKTEFTKEAAELAGKRLPVPSHDTFFWYMAERLPDRKWCWHSFKKLGCGNQTKIDKLKSVVESIEKEELERRLNRAPEKSNA